MPPWVMLGRLMLAAICSGLIGYERATAMRAAGLRTHTLVGVGAAAFTLVSMTGFGGPDPSRVAAQIVSGIGFLGAGAIFREGQLVRGLTTAAGLWVAASIGMAAGSGSYWLAVLGTLVTLGTLVGLRALETGIRNKRVKVQRRLEVHIGDTTKLEKLLDFIGRIDPDAEQVDFRKTGKSEGVLTVGCNENELAKIADMVSAHKSVTKVEELSPLYWHQKPRRFPSS